MAYSGAELPQLSTDEFYNELVGIDFGEESPRIRKYRVDLEPSVFIGAISVGNVLTVIPSSDGAISHVREDPEAATADNSASSRYFTLHSDGIYLPDVPEMVVLHCLDPGSSETPTVFVDTKDIIDALRDTDRFDEATDYDHVFKNKKGDTFVRPLVETNPVNNEPIMNIAIASPQCHLRPAAYSGRTQAEANSFYDLLDEIAEGVTVVSHIWEKNDAIVFDNLRLVHGRGLQEQKIAEICDSQRHLHRIWVGRQDAHPAAATE